MWSAVNLYATMDETFTICGRLSIDASGGHYIFFHVARMKPRAACMVPSPTVG